jgi:hypothetical protein
VAERCRDEETVQRNLYSARIDLGTREHMRIEWCILSELPCGNAS